jgi:hypothetical protein
MQPSGMLNLTIHYAVPPTIEPTRRHVLYTLPNIGAGIEDTENIPEGESPLFAHWRSPLVTRKVVCREFRKGRLITEQEPEWVAGQLLRVPS